MPKKGRPKGKASELEFDKDDYQGFRGGIDVKLDRKMDDGISILEDVLSKHIKDTLDSIINQDLPSQEYEVIIADGMSNDNTKDIINTFMTKHDNIVLIKNTQKISAAGWNKCLKVGRLGKTTLNLQHPTPK